MKTPKKKAKATSKKSTSDSRSASVQRTVATSGTHRSNTYRKVAGSVSSPGKARSTAERNVSALRLGSKLVRDIYPLPISGINWNRRESCKLDLIAFCKTYMPAVFQLEFGEYHISILTSAERVILRGGMKAVAVPRGGGKTAMCRAAILWGTLYGHIHFPFFIGSKQDKAVQTLEFLKVYLYRNKLLVQDFPEVTYPIQRLDGNNLLAAGQIFRGLKTYIGWESLEIRFPALLLSNDEAKSYPSDFLIRVPDFDDSYVIVDESSGYATGVKGKAYTTLNSGCVIRCSGIDGSIRGEADVHPLTLTQPRPDLALLDDIQKDQSADSPAQCDKLEMLIDGAVRGLAGPGKKISSLMPCTVIRDSDVSDRYLNRSTKPEWGGVKYPMVVSWPNGITDDEIGDSTPEATAWSKYAEYRNRSLQEHEDISLATNYYEENRKLMDSGFIVSWEHRFTNDEGELSPQQHAMNLRLSNPITFQSEFQNKPKRNILGGTQLLTVEMVKERYTSIARLVLPSYVNFVTTYIDVQDEILFYSTFGGGEDFTGVITDYGWFPETNRLNPQQYNSRFVTKANAARWRELSNVWFQHNPSVKPTIGKKGHQAPLEGKIYLGLKLLVQKLLATKYVRDDGVEMKHNLIGIDAQWGLATNVIYRFIREFGDNRIVPCHGKFIGAASKPFSDYVSKEGQWKGDHWIIGSSGGKGTISQRYLLIDTNYWKSFLHSSMAVPMGAPGAVFLYNASSPEDHEMIARHIAGAEYPETMVSREHKVDEWKERPERFDNDYLDATCGALCLASVLGARSVVSLTSIESSQTSQRKQAKKLSEAYWQKRRREGR